MQARLTLALALSSVLLAACGGGSNSSRAVPTPPATNGNGTPATGVITARFDPSAGVVPLPNNLLLSGTTDLTLNIPVANPANYGDPQVALNALDGWSTVSPWSFSFSAAPKAGTAVGGSTVRVFEVTLTGPGGGVTGVTRELASPAEFVVAAQQSDTSGRTYAIVPTKPLKQLTSYMAVVTSGVTDASGNDATPDTTYFLAKRTSALCVNGKSTEPLLPDANACALEPLRLLTNSQLAAAASKGISPDKVVVSWVATTQSTTAVLGQLASKIAQTPVATTRFANTGKTLGDLGLGLAPIANIYIGTLDVPYYLGAPSAQAPTAPLTTFWQAAPGAYVAPFNQAGLDPTSRNVTAFNPFPVATKTETIPVLLTLPNAASGKTKPAAGWPVVIFQHGITRNRTDAFAIAQTLASQGFAVIAIDAPLHGITDKTSPFYIGNSPFAALGAHERTFDVDYSNNDTGAAGPDGKIDASGSYFINLTSLLTSRDNIRQAVADLLVLSRAIPSISLDGSTTAFDGSRIQFVGQSLGGIIGTDFTAVNPAVAAAVLNVPGGGIPGLLNASPTFGPRIRAGLAAAGLQPNTPDFDSFFGAAQQAVDSADPINFAYALANRKVLLQEVVGTSAATSDQVIPNSVQGAPLSGTEPLIAALGLAPITASAQSATGIRGVVRFTQGNHGSLLDPTQAPAVTVEMQTEMASMLVSGGNAVQVTNTSVIKTQ